ncbi:MAG: polyprenyl synthetase family protein [Lentisphaerae bacterium]|nr:polyprenyl synthetase family protein [Lentisphaerota bacterium]
MLKQIKGRIEREIGRFAAQFQQPPLSAIPRPFSELIEQFLRRDGKRLRSLLFVLGYRGFSAREPRNLYRSAAALELLHDFILIHDDLIDHASLRRGGASMHESLDLLLNGQRGLRFRGQDLALIVGDMLYAMAINGFLSIAESPVRKQRALELLTQTALYTGCGELDELLYTLRPLADVDPRGIYRVYDWKTGHYTFSSPLSMGATLGGAATSDVKALAAIGTSLGRAFQIRDDLLDLYGAGNRFGKPVLIDLREGKKTLPVWHAYRVCKPSERKVLERVLENPGADEASIQKAADIIDRSGALDFSSGEMARLLEDATRKLRRTHMRPPYRDELIEYARHLLQPPTRAGVVIPAAT